MQLTKGQREIVDYLYRRDYQSFSIGELVDAFNALNPRGNYTRSMISDKVKRLFERQIVRRTNYVPLNKTFYYQLTPHARRNYASDIK